MAKARTVVFVNGAWMHAGCWDDFRKPFEAAGYAVHTPSWPLLGGAPVAQLRASPPPGLGALTVGEIVDHHQAFIDTLDEAPLIVGHSFGGLFTQMLLARGAGVAGIALEPAPAAFVIPGPASLAAAFPILNRINGWNRPYTLSFAGFQRSFANGNAEDFQRAAYERLVVPTSGRIFYQAASSLGTNVEPKKRTQPLLITGAERDRTVDLVSAHGAHRLQAASPAPTEYKEFAGHSHFLIGEPGWEEVAAYCLDWAARQA